MAGIEIRNCNYSDSTMVFDWKNSEDARKYARNMDEISLVDHAIWFSFRISKIQQEPFWIATLNGISAGYVRFDKPIKNRLEFEVSIFISSDYRNLGLAKEFLNACLCEMNIKFPEAKIFAHVHKDNIPSRKLFESLNFVLTGSRDNHDILIIIL
jgi:RimJ/RimL family protein N-acetyltransferase